MAEFDYEGFWNETLRQLRTELGEEGFSAWFSDIKYLRSGENSIVVGFPSGFHRDRIKARYQNGIRAKLKKLADREIALEFEIIPGNKAENTPPKQNAYICYYAAGDAPGSSGDLNENPAAKKPKKNQHPQMRDDYTFEKYIIGESNNFAANAALAISKNPGTAYNPFLIYGGVGLGKTHLMQAVGNYIHQNSDHKVIYVTSEDFLNEFVQSYRDRELDAAFKKKYRFTDVLLIDDIQFFQSKESIQDEFFHTFNALINAKKQLVMTCDRSPSELKLHDRIISRFEQSLRVDLQPPRYEMRVAILKDIAENRNINIAERKKIIIPDDVIELLCKNISSNIRDLIGAFNTLISYTELMNQPVTIEIAQKRLRDVFASRKQSNLSMEIIQKAVADFYSLSSNDLKGKKRNQKIVYPRQLSMYICREMTDFSTTEIGEAFGGRDHTTVMHSIDKIQSLLITDPSLDSTIENLKRKVKELSAKT